jgi:hypothetical protein
MRSRRTDSLNREHLERSHLHAATAEDVLFGLRNLSRGLHADQVVLEAWDLLAEHGEPVRYYRINIFWSRIDEMADQSMAQQGLSTGGIAAFQLRT